MRFQKLIPKGPSQCATSELIANWNRFYEFVLKRLDIKGRFNRLLCLITAKKASFP